MIYCIVISSIGIGICIIYLILMIRRLCDIVKYGNEVLKAIIDNSKDEILRSHSDIVTTFTCMDVWKQKSDAQGSCTQGTDKQVNIVPVKKKRSMSEESRQRMKDAWVKRKEKKELREKGPYTPPPENYDMTIQ